MLSVSETLEKYSNEIYIGLYKILNSSTGSLHNPCFNPPVSKMFKEYFEGNNGLWKEISNNNGYDFDKDIINNYIKKTREGLLLKDKTIWFLILVSIHFFNKQKTDKASKDLMFLSSYIIYLKYYTSLSNKHMPAYCDKEKAMLALSTLSEKSLFSSKNNVVLTRAKTILNEYGLNTKIKSGLSASNISLGMIYLYDKIKEVYYPEIKSLNDVNKIASLIITIRDRLSQSFKAYARQYYKIINTNINSNDEESNEIEIANNVDKALNMTAQGMTYIPENHFQVVHRMCEIPSESLKQMFNIIFKRDNYDTAYNCLNIIMREKGDFFNNTNEIEQWLSEVKKVIAIRSKNDFRIKLVALITSDSDFKNYYDKVSVGFKHKIIQGTGLLLGLALFDSLKQYMLGSINTFYIV